MEIIGLRIEKYIGQSVSGHNCNFEYKDAVFEKHILCAILSTKQKVEIELSRSEGECGSGWCAASYGDMKVTTVGKFSYTHRPVKRIVVADLDETADEVSNEVFSFSAYGGDAYYPSGGYRVNMELFKETIRAKQQRPVWIFLGKSNSGKSYLSSKLNGLDVYETDSSKELPESITASVVVLGNKYKFEVEDITKRLFGDVEVQIVNFQ